MLDKLKVVFVDERGANFDDHSKLELRFIVEGDKYEISHLVNELMDVYEKYQDVLYKERNKTDSAPKPTRTPHPTVKLIDKRTKR